MPPKRGARAPRGGGRGHGAPQTNEAAFEPVASNNSARPVLPPSQDVSMPDAPTATHSTAKVETRAPDTPGVPGGAPIQRHASLRGRGRGRGAPVAGAVPPAFKPKAVRRDQSERQKAAEEEAKRIKERNRAMQMEEERGRGRGRGLFRGGRSRGDAMGKRTIPGHASGVFSQAPQRYHEGKGPRIGSSKDTNTVAVIGSSGYEGPSDHGDYNVLSGRSKTDHDASESGGGGRAGGSDAVKVKRELPPPVYPDQVPGQGLRDIDIEKINLISDDEDEAASGKGKGRAPASRGARGLKPVRIPRQDHQERPTLVASEASGSLLAEDGKTADDADDTNDGDDSMFVQQDLEAERRRRNKAGVTSRDATGKPWASVWSDEEDNIVRIKPEPGTSDAMDIDNIPVAVPQEILSHAEAQMAEAANAEVPVANEGPLPKAKSKLRRKPSWLERYPEGLHTAEDKAEWLRHKFDKEMVAEEFRTIAVKPEADHADGDIDMEKQVENNNAEGRLYLFSFPPKMPPLYNPSHIKKEEPTGEGDGPIQMSSKPAPGIAGSSIAPIDFSKPANPADAVIESRDIKKDPDERMPQNSSRAIEKIVPEEGFIGKMIVRKSGKVEFSWGGTSFEVGRGFDHDFLVSTMLMDKLDDGASAPASSSLGSVKGSFIVTPDWSQYKME